MASFVSECKKIPSNKNVEFWPILSLNICESFAEDSDRQVQHPGHYTALVGNNVDCKESSGRKKDAGMVQKIAERQGDAEEERC